MTDNISFNNIKLSSLTRGTLNGTLIDKKSLEAQLSTVKVSLDNYYTKQEIDNIVNDFAIMCKSTYYEFPNIGERSVFYVDIEQHDIYIWEENSMAYICVGSDTTKINTIDGGGA